MCDCEDWRYRGALLRHMTGGMTSGVDEWPVEPAENLSSYFPRSRCPPTLLSRHLLSYLRRPLSMDVPHDCLLGPPESTNHWLGKPSASGYLPCQQPHRANRSSPGFG